MSFLQTIYLDKEFISDLYEETTGTSPDVIITKLNGSKAGVKALFMNAGVSSTESKSYKVSTSKMLIELENALRSYTRLDNGIETQLTSNSKYFWVSGSMNVAKSTISTQKESDEEPEIKGEEKYFNINDDNGNRFPLITKSDYFSLNMSELVALTDTVIKTVSFKVDALLKVLPAKTLFNGWVSIPLIIRESSS